MRPVKPLIGLILAVSVPHVALADPKDAALGREIAVQACSACHKVTAAQKSPAPVPNPDELTEVQAPSFAAIAAKYDRKDPALRAFILDPRHPMRQQDWQESDLKAVVAYIHSLHAAKATW